MTALLLFTFGVIIGSFLNVVALRYSEDKSIFSLAHLGGRSSCQHCHQNLAWYELVPILSFLVQRGKCWICMKKLSWQYPLVELASGLAFLLPLYFINFFNIQPYSIIQSAVWISAFLIFILIWAIDFRLYIIPDELNLLLAISGLILSDAQNFYGKFSEFSGSFLGSYAALFGLRNWGVWQNHLLAMLIGASIVGIIMLLTRGKGMGMGDLKLLAALGLLFGWPDVLFIFMIASVIGSAVSLILMLFQKKTWKSSVPFGPFLVIGAALVFFFGENILKGYFNFFGF